MANLALSMFIIHLCNADEFRKREIRCINVSFKKWAQRFQLFFSLRLLLLIRPFLAAFLYCGFDGIRKNRNII